MLWLLDKAIAFFLYLFAFGSLMSAIITYGHNPSAVNEIAIDVSMGLLAVMGLSIRSIIVRSVKLKRPGIWFYRICGLFVASAIGVFGIMPLMLWMIDGIPPLDTMMKVLQTMTKHEAVVPK